MLGPALREWLQRVRQAMKTLVPQFTMTAW